MNSYCHNSLFKFEQTGHSNYNKNLIEEQIQNHSKSEITKEQHRHERINPQVASLWLTLDDVDETNGGMEILSFTAQPESRHRNVPKDFILNSGGDTKGFDNFNLTLDENKLNKKSKRSVFIKRGEAEFHSAWTVHRSDPNRSSRRRMAWIVRYCPTGTKVVAGMRGSFDSNYPLIPVLGMGAEKDSVYESLSTITNFTDLEKEKIYAPCYGNSDLLNLLKK